MVEPLGNSIGTATDFDLCRGDVRPPLHGGLVTGAATVAAAPGAVEVADVDLEEPLCSRIGAVDLCRGGVTPPLQGGEATAAAAEAATACATALVEVSVRGVAAERCVRRRGLGDSALEGQRDCATTAVMPGTACPPSFAPPVGEAAGGVTDPPAKAKSLWLPIRPRTCCSNDVTNACCSRPKRSASPSSVLNESTCARCLSSNAWRRASSSSPCGGGVTTTFWIAGGVCL